MSRMIRLLAVAGAVVAAAGFGSGSAGADVTAMGRTWINASPNWQQTTSGGYAGWGVEAGNPEGDITIACLETPGDGSGGRCSPRAVYVNWSVGHYYDNCYQYDARARFGAVSDGEPAHVTAETVTVAVRNNGTC